MIVNQEFARRFFGGEQDALGKRFRFAQGTPLMEIVGIAGDAHYDSLYQDHQLYMFLPAYQHPRGRMTLLVGAQSGDDLSGVVERARREIAQMDARLPVFGVMMARENLSLAFWPSNVAAGMASTFGVLALVLATMGLYSVMTYTVSQRTHEIGIRMALGAQRGDILRLITRQGMALALVGLVLGLGAAAGSARVISSLLFGVSPTDAYVFAAISLALALVALLACYIPARRATKVDPMVALRYE